jgi:uncharacterized membrane protein YeaQ/YmgE (transglycosylase-associated protein family)
MSIIGWILLGLISGFIASKIVNKSGEGFFLDIILGIVGAIVGGFIFTAVGASGITGFNIYSMVVAVIGAIVVLVIYHAVAGRRAYRAREAPPDCMAAITATFLLESTTDTAPRSDLR